MTQAELLKEEYNQDDNNALHSNSDPEYDAWFRAEVEEGLREIERGEVITHEEAMRHALERCKRLTPLSNFLYQILAHKRVTCRYITQSGTNIAYFEAPILSRFFYRRIFLFMVRVQSPNGMNFAYARSFFSKYKFSY